MGSETCETCRWWESGLCHRYPPITVKDGPHYYNVKNVRPQTSRYDWCGEHKPKDTQDG